jgi:hypothetical protein
MICVTATRRHTPLLGAAACPLSAAAGVGAATIPVVVAGGAPTPITAAGSRVIDAQLGAVADWASRSPQKNDNTSVLGSVSSEPPAGYLIETTVPPDR